MGKSRISIIKKAICTAMCAGLLTAAAGGCEKTPEANEPNGRIATKEELTAANAVVRKNELLIGCWIPPRSHQMTNEEVANERMAELKASGLNCISTHHSDLSNMRFLQRTLDAAEKNGVKVIIELVPDLSKGGVKTNLTYVRKTFEHPAVIGYNLFDEPGESAAAALADEFAQIREITGDSKLLLINMLPNYGPQQSMAPVPADGLTWYQTYLDTFLKTGTDVLSFDFYPYSANPAGDVSSIQRMMSNLSDIALMSQKYGVPSWGFVQDSSWSGMRVPDDNELLLISHLHLIFGLESYSYFLYADTSNPGEGSFVGMLRWDNTLSDVYYRVQRNNMRLASMGYRFLSYSLKGFLTDKLSLPGYADVLDGSFRPGSDEKLKSFDADFDTLIGVFEGRSEEDNIARGYATDPADKGYYVLNFDRDNQSSVTLKFDTKTPYTVWGPNGIEAMGEGDSVSFDIDPCDARFVELRTFFAE